MMKLEFHDSTIGELSMPDAGRLVVELSAAIVHEPVVGDDFNGDTNVYVCRATLSVSGVDTIRVVEPGRIAGEWISNATYADGHSIDLIAPDIDIPLKEVVLTMVSGAIVAVSCVEMRLVVHEKLRTLRVRRNA